jgi:hypothetical protein
MTYSKIARTISKLEKSAPIPSRALGAFTERGTPKRSKVDQDKINLAEPWKPGQSGNPNGRPKGSRNKINQETLNSLSALQEKYGDTIWEMILATKPEVIGKIFAGLLPKQDEAKQPLEDLTDEELDALAKALLAKYGGEGEGAHEFSTGSTENAWSAEAPQARPPLSETG